MRYWKEKARYEKEHSCEICKKIVRGDLYPIQRTIFGKVKNDICEDCRNKYLFPEQ